MNMQERFSAILGDRAVFHEPLSRHTSFQIGGVADYFLLPQSAQELAQVITLCREAGLPFYLLGNGTNLLVGDEGFRGAVVTLSRMQSVTVKGTEIEAQAGAALAKVSQDARDAGLSGLAFACGIPGSVGGAVVMNAGAYGGEINTVLKTVTLLTRTGEVRELPKEALGLGYRHSSLMETGDIVLGAVFSLTPGDKEEIADEMRSLLRERAAKQPLNLPSAGSTFKRPTGYYAGKLIQDAGLAGFQVGGAQVSTKHCGFVVNTGGASAKDVRDLVREVSRIVYESFGVRLEPEIRYLGETEEGWR